LSDKLSGRKLSGIVKAIYLPLAALIMLISGVIACNLGSAPDNAPAGTDPQTNLRTDPFAVTAPKGSLAPVITATPMQGGSDQNTLQNNSPQSTLMPISSPVPVINACGEDTRQAQAQYTIQAAISAGRQYLT
ncbi:hypothetical protein, partial [Corallococcus praedator]|uniref:hypothetical protein n=1 Tax=Corallococcus praedator TaxID=2316724 RepID=UPI0013153F8D